MIKRLINRLADGDSGEILTKGFSFLLIRVGGTIIAFLFSRYITKNFGADVYGLIALSFSIFLVIGVLGKLGLDTNIVKFFSLTRDKEDSGLFYQSILKVFLASGILSGVVYWQSEFLVEEVFKEPKPELIPYLNWILPAIPFWSVTVLSASLLRSKQMNNWFGFFNNTSRFTLALGLLLVFSLYSSEPIIIVQAHFYAIVLACIWSCSLAFSSLKNSRFTSKKNSWQFAKESLPMMMSASVLVLLAWAGTFVMGIYRDSEEVGIYNVAVKVATLLNFCLQAVNSILAPKIASKFSEGERDASQKMITFSTKLNSISSLVIGIIILVFNQQILGFFGEEFKSARYLLFVLCFGQIINSFSGSVGVVLQMTGKQIVYQYFMLSALVINLILMFTLTPVYGAYGAAVASIVSMIFWNIGGAIYLKRQMGIRSYYYLSIISK